MIRIKRELLDQAVEAVRACAMNSTNSDGLRIKFEPEAQAVENAVLGALSIIAPNGGPCTASDVHFISGFGTDESVVFPLHREGSAT